MRYVVEEGSPQGRTLLRRFSCLTSAISPLEANSALYRRFATGQLHAQELSRRQTFLQRDRPHWELLGVDRQILERAEEIIHQTSVRTLDAVHLATAIFAQTYAGHRMSFITRDTRQRDAGEHLELDVVWVG